MTWLWWIRYFFRFLTVMFLIGTLTMLFGLLLTV